VFHRVGRRMHLLHTSPGSCVQANRTGASAYYQATSPPAPEVLEAFSSVWAATVSIALSATSTRLREVELSAIDLSVLSRVASASPRQNSAGDPCRVQGQWRAQVSARPAQPSRPNQPSARGERVGARRGCVCTQGGRRGVCGGSTGVYGMVADGKFCARVRVVGLHRCRRTHELRVRKFEPRRGQGRHPPCSCGPIGVGSVGHHVRRFRTRFQLKGTVRPLARRVNHDTRRAQGPH
jgi:hypothetical protein